MPTYIVTGLVSVSELWKWYVTAKDQEDAKRKVEFGAARFDSSRRTGMSLETIEEVEEVDNA